MFGTKFYRDSSEVPKLKSPVVGTIGNFDGVHLGHQSLIQKVTGRAQDLNGTSVLISFYPHPSLVFGRIDSFSYLSTFRQLQEELSKLGVDYAFFCHFTKDFATLSADSFIKDFLVKRFGINYCVLGPDLRVGKNRQGDADYILDQLRKIGSDGEIAQFVFKDELRISSGRIRQSINEGNLVEARALLGRYYGIDGKVIRGDGRGASIGFPTANLGYFRQMKPLSGVYCSYVSLKGEKYPAVTNVGFRPTFQGRSERIESFLYNYSGPDFYGERIRVEFVRHLRGEVEFENVVELRTQISKDIEQSRRILES